MDWLQVVVQGGAIGILAIVLYGVWRMFNRIMDMMDAQIEHIRESVAVQAQISERLDQIGRELQQHEVQSQERNQRLARALGQEPFNATGR